MKPLIVCGSRSILDINVNNAFDVIDRVFKEGEYTQIVSGGASGGDVIGEVYAKHYKIPLRIFPADWSRFGKFAGPIRNKEMVEFALQDDGGLIALNGGRGTANILKIAKEKGLRIEYNENKCPVG